MTLNPALMLDFNWGVEGIPTINLMKDEIKVSYLPHRGNIANGLEDGMDMLAFMTGPLTHQQTAHARLSKLPTAPIDQQLFSLVPIGKVEALMSKENRTLILIKIGTEEALTHFNVHASQDEASYDVDVSNAEEDDIKVVPDKADDT